MCNTYNIKKKSTFLWNMWVFFTFILIQIILINSRNLSEWLDWPIDTSFLIFSVKYEYDIISLKSVSIYAFLFWAFVMCPEVKCLVLMDSCRFQFHNFTDVCLLFLKQRKKKPNNLFFKFSTWFHFRGFIYLKMYVTFLFTLLFYSLWKSKIKQNHEHVDTFFLTSLQMIMNI